MKKKKQTSLEFFNNDEINTQRVEKDNPKLFKIRTLKKYFKTYKTYYLISDVYTNPNFYKNEIKLLNKIITNNKEIIELKKNYEDYLNELNIKKAKQEKIEKRKKLQIAINNLTDDDIISFKDKYFKLFNEKDIFELNLTKEFFTELEIAIGKKLINEQNRDYNEKRKKEIFKLRQKYN